MSKTERPPVITVLGHVDHGKSKLLDYIRKANIVEGEAGGITQHLGAYEVEHEVDGEKKKITFLDTPGHAAFQAIRSRGVDVADIAILVVAADEGVKAQTIEALETIKSANLPYIVALNKMDKPGVDLNWAKTNLSEHEIYVEEWGGSIPCVPISALDGTGVDDLLSMMLLVSELEELTGDTNILASGAVAEANIDPKKGITATLLIKDGSIKQGQYVTVGDSVAPVRIMEDFKGKKITEATLCAPIKIIGFNKIPSIGVPFQVFENKKEAEKTAAEYSDNSINNATTFGIGSKHLVTLPIVLRADVTGSIEAIKHELEKIKNDRVLIKIVTEGIGAITEADVQMLSNDPLGIVIGFNANVDGRARDLSEKQGTEIKTFDIIYRLAEWLEEKMAATRPEIDTEEEVASVKILKYFSTQKDKQLFGGRVQSGVFSIGDTFKLSDDNSENPKTGKVVGLQSNKQEVQKVDADTEFGAMVTYDGELNPGKIITAFKVVRS